MSIGPCLCGDPYCASCGDPSAAAFEDLVERLAEELSQLDDIECRLFVDAGRMAVKNFRTAQKWIKERQESDGDWSHDYLAAFRDGGMDQP